VASAGGRFLTGPGNRRWGEIDQPGARVEMELH